MSAEDEFTEQEKEGLLSRAVHENELGELLPPKAMFLHMSMGTAELGDDKFELMTSATSGLPIVRHVGSKRYFVLSWLDVIKLAIARDIRHPS